MLIRIPKGAVRTFNETDSKDGGILSIVSYNWVKNNQTFNYSFATVKRITPVVPPTTDQVGTA